MATEGQRVFSMSDPTGQFSLVGALGPFGNGPALYGRGGLENLALAFTMPSNEAVLNAVYQRDLITLRLLAESGNSLNLPDDRGNPPLIIAAKLRYHDVLQTLLQCGASADQADKAGSTALHWAAALGHREAVAVLMSGGANVRSINMQGKTPADVARLNNHPQIGALLDGQAETRSTDINTFALPPLGTTPSAPQNILQNPQANQSNIPNALSGSLPSNQVLSTALGMQLDLNDSSLLAALASMDMGRAGAGAEISSLGSIGSINSLDLNFGLGTMDLGEISIGESMDFGLDSLDIVLEDPVINAEDQNFSQGSTTDQTKQAPSKTTLGQIKRETTSQPSPTHMHLPPLMPLEPKPDIKHTPPPGQVFSFSSATLSCVDNSHSCSSPCAHSPQHPPGAFFGSPLPSPVDIGPHKHHRQTNRPSPVSSPASVRRTSGAGIVGRDRKMECGSNPIGIPQSPLIPTNRAKAADPSPRVGSPFSSPQNSPNSSPMPHRASSKAKKQAAAKGDAEAKPATPRVCTVCGTTRTPQWRRGLDGNSCMCNSCGLKAKHRQKRQQQLAESMRRNSSALVDQSNAADDATGCLDD
eukprot:comp11445_c0_seq1/m.5865 comp11445_c0_seq1/g.5865  ORF comp11445_c0_seq1/g.5865 comp11445_c0_seq1/m.5865 type:complete len:586 (-) comp11445_c0_seq1:566-2323(-)